MQSGPIKRAETRHDGGPKLLLHIEARMQVFCGYVPTLCPVVLHVTAFIGKKFSEPFDHSRYQFVGFLHGLTRFVDEAEVCVGPFAAKGFHSRP